MSKIPDLSCLRQQTRSGPRKGRMQAEIFLRSNLQVIRELGYQKNKSFDQKWSRKGAKWSQNGSEMVSGSPKKLTKSFLEGLALSQLNNFSWKATGVPFMPNFVPTTIIKKNGVCILLQLLTLLSFSSSICFKSEGWSPSDAP